jgi:hypothetical protein
VVSDSDPVPDEATRSALTVADPPAVEPKENVSVVSAFVVNLGVPLPVNVRLVTVAICSAVPDTTVQVSAIVPPTPKSNVLLVEVLESKTPVDNVNVERESVPEVSVVVLVVPTLKLLDNVHLPRELLNVTGASSVAPKELSVLVMAVEIKLTTFVDVEVIDADIINPPYKLVDALTTHEPVNPVKSMLFAVVIPVIVLLPEIERLGEFADVNAIFPVEKTLAPAPVELIGKLLLGKVFVPVVPALKIVPVPVNTMLPVLLVIARVPAAFEN